MLPENSLHKKIFSISLCFVPFVFGCGGGTAPPPSQGSLYEQSGSPTAPAGTTAPGQSSGTAPSTGGGQGAGNQTIFADGARKAADYLDGMSAEYEGFYRSGQQSVQLKRTEEMYQLIDPLSRDISNISSPALEAALAIQKEALPRLIESIKRAELAELHFEREYNIGFGGMNPFGGSGGHEIGDGIRAARAILNRIQYNIPAAQKLGTGAPPTIGGPPPANRSFGPLRQAGLDDTSFKKFGSRTNDDDIVPWRMQVDSATTIDEISDATDLEIEAPGTDALPTAFYTPMNVIHPAMPSPMVGIGLNENRGQQRQIWSMQPRKRVGIVRRLQLGKSQTMALSPDGKYFSARPEDSSIIGLYDIGKGEPIAQVEHEFGAREQESLFFAADNRLVLIGEESIYIWSTPDLRPERQIPVENPVLKDTWVPGLSWSISPGGRYLAVPRNKGFRLDIRFFDLTTGEAAGAISYADKIHARFVSSSFSRDGKQLAILIESPFNTWLQIWDVASGRITASYTQDVQLSDKIRPHKLYQGPAIEWFPDNEHVLLFGKGLFDTVSGQGKRLINSSVHYRIKPVGSERVVAIMDKVFKSYDLKELPENPVSWNSDRIVASASGRPSTGALTGPKKPAASSTDRSSIRYIERPKERVWSVTADAGSSRAGLPVSLSGFSAEHLYHAAVAAKKQHVVLGFTSQTPRIWNGETQNIKGMQSWVEHVSLAGAAQPSRLNFSFPSGLLGVSPSGTHVLTRDFEGFNRFDLWDLAAGSHLAGFIPYAQGRSDGGAPILWGDFVDDDHVITISSGQLTCWRIPDGQAEFELSISTPSGWPAFSPNRKQLALISGSTLSVISTETGEFLGHASDWGLNGDLVAVGFRPDGGELAVLAAPNGGGELALIDITSGEMTLAFPLPLSGDQLVWCDNDYVLIDGAYCVSLEKMAIAWIYHLNGVRIDSPPGTSQFFLSKSKYNSPFELHSTSLPTQELLTAIETADPPNDVVLTDGGRIAFDIQIPSPPGRSNFTEEVITSLAQNFSDAGITVDPSAPLVLVVRGSHGKTGEGISIGSFGPSFSDRSDIDEERVTWTLSIRQENQTLWQRSISANNTGSIRLDENSSGSSAASQAEQQLREQMWKKAATSLLNFRAPKYVFGPEAGTGLGNSKLGE